MRADRLLSILLMLQNRGKLTAGELAAQLEVSERTIYRDMDALSSAGIPVYCERGPGGGCGLLESYRTNLTGLTQDEVRALFMLSIPSPLQQLGVDQDLRAAWLKLSAALPDILRHEGTRAQARIHLDSRDWSPRDEPTPHLGIVQLALWSDRCLELTYRLAFNAQVQHEVEPYGLVAKSNQWHLVCSRDGALFVLLMADILDAKLSERTVTLPPGFNLESFWEEWTAINQRNHPSFHAQVRISPQLFDMLLYFKDPILAWDLTTQEPGEDGWYQVEVHFKTFEEARERLLNFGGAVEILAPLALRESVLDFAQQTLAVYQREVYR